MHILDITSYIDKEDVTYVPKVTTYVVQHTTQLTNQGPHLVYMYNLNRLGKPIFLFGGHHIIYGTCGHYVAKLVGIAIPNDPR